MPRTFAVRLAGEPEAKHYLEKPLGRLRRRYWVQSWNSVTFIYVEDLADACRVVLTCPRLRLIGTDAHDMPVPPAEYGGHHYTVRMVLAIEGGRQDPRNRATGTYLEGAGHLYTVTKARLWRSGDLVAHMHLPTLRDAIDLMRACPHLRLIADRYDRESHR